VLVVDDDPVLRHLVNRWLSERGYAVIEAEDGLGALHIVLARTQRVDLVLTDVDMPLLGGRELAAVLRATSPRTPVVLMSGAETALEAPGPGQEGSGLELLPKPFTADQLVTALEHASHSM
jgi:CheY-like chemotaxis protein